MTTNFDRLTETALLTYTNRHARVIAHEEMLGVIKVHDSKPSIIKIHRDMQFSPISDIDDIEELDPRWNDITSALLAQYNVVCLGYGGNDDGLMKVLNDELKDLSHARVYWCVRGTDSPNLEELFSECLGQIKKVKIDGFDEFMLLLNQALDYDLLEVKITLLSEKLQKKYDDQLIKLMKSTKGKESSNAIKELMARTWWEVEIEVENEGDINEKDRLYKEGILKFPESYQLLGNYANFLNNYLKDFDAAEEFYKRALALNPDNPISNGNYAVFLENSRKDYPQAARYYKSSIALEPTNSANNLNYAIFLSSRIDDLIEAQHFFKKVLDMDPTNPSANRLYANFLADKKHDFHNADYYFNRALEFGSHDWHINMDYAVFLMDSMRDYERALIYFNRALHCKPDAMEIYLNIADLHLQQRDIENADKFLNDVETSECPPDCQLVLSFYRFAFFQKDNKKNKDTILRLLEAGYTYPGWSFSGAIKQAEKQGHENIEELKVLAARISVV